MQGFLFNGGIVNFNGIEHTKEKNRKYYHGHRDKRSQVKP